MRARAFRIHFWANAALLLVPFLFFVYLPTFAWLGRQWLGAGLFANQARDWSHGPLVVLLIGYLLWRRRQEFSPARISPWAMPLVLGGLGLHWASVPLDAPYLSAYSLIPLSLGVLCLFFGSRTASHLITPFLLFVLAVPFPATQWGVTGFLAKVVAIGSAFFARLAGAPVYRTGETITVGQDEYLVEPLCSGFNLIMALLALLIPFLYLRGASVKSLGAALLWVPPLGLATKILLVSTVLVLTPRIGQDAVLGMYHGWLGLSFYLASLAMALLVVPLVTKKPSQRLSQLGATSQPVV